MTERSPDTAAARPGLSSSAAFKTGMRKLANGVSIVCAHTTAGQPVGMTVSSATSLTADPPTLLVCINRSTELARALTTNAPFSVNVLAASQETVARAFGGQIDVRGPDRFAHGSWRRSAVGEVPILVDCRASFECTVAHVHDWQSHHIVIGAVVDVHFPIRDSAPLIYVDANYSTLTSGP